MFKDRREKGASHKALQGTEGQKPPLTDDQFQILWLLFTRHRFSRPGLEWDDLLMELELIDIPEEDADDFLKALRDRVDPWLTHTPGFGAYLNRQHIDAIKTTLQSFLENRKGAGASHK